MTIDIISPLSWIFYAMLAFNLILIIYSRFKVSKNVKEIDGKWRPHRSAITNILTQPTKASERNRFAALEIIQL